MIISRTPYRISFFGGGSDYPDWYRNHGGQVLASAINKYCYITCRYLPPFFEHRIHVVYSKIESCQTVDQIEHPAVRETLKFLNIERGIEIHHDGDLPARSGMGSSSSFTVGLLNALYALKGYMPGKPQLAKESIHIEQDRLNETVGSQDQVSAAYGGFNHISFPSNGDISVKPVTLSPQRVDELDDHLMLFYTGIARTASAIAGSYVPDIASRESEIREITGMVDEGLAILNSQRDIASFGKLLDRAWHSKRNMSAMVSNSHVDEIYERAQKAGATGGKLLGAGGGGFMLLFAHPSKQQKIKESLSRLIQVPFKFENSGSQIIFFDAEEDYSAEELFRANQPVDEFRELISREI
ncbi:MAG: kinase [Chloroflexi bacterium]|nr:kinase [Chloroflexota bacterium]